MSKDWSASKQRAHRSHSRQIAKKLGHPGVIAQPTRITDGGNVIWSNEDAFKMAPIAISRRVFYECPHCTIGFTWDKSRGETNCPWCKKIVKVAQMIDLWSKKDD